jgi:hypothetical protein
MKIPENIDAKERFYNQRHLAAKEENHKKRF